MRAQLMSADGSTVMVYENVGAVGVHGPYITLFAAGPDPNQPGAPIAFINAGPGERLDFPENDAPPQLIEVPKLQLVRN